MLFDSSIRKELARSFGAILVVLITVVMTMMLIRTLGQASRGSVSPSDVMLVMGFTVVGQLPTILSLSLFIAIVGTLSRMYRDSEMVIWFASGRGLASLLRPLLHFAWPVILAVALLALLAWPWANQQIQALKFQYEQRSDIDRIAPGEFQESANGQRVFFMDKDSSIEGALAHNVFIATTEPRGETMTSAHSARMEVRVGERFVVLTDGQRLESSAIQPGLKISQFTEYTTRIGTGSSNAPADASVKIRSTAQLLELSSPLHQAELGWRIGLVLAAFNFVVLALALASVNPRAGRSTNMVVALFAFMVYYNFLTLGQSWVGAEKITLVSFLLMLHGGTLLLCSVLVLARHRQWSLRQWLRPPVAA